MTNISTNKKNYSTGWLTCAQSSSADLRKAFPGHWTINEMTLGVRELTSPSCMSTDPLSHGDQNCNHMNLSGGARQYGWLTARLSPRNDDHDSELRSG